MGYAFMGQVLKVYFNNENLMKAQKISGYFYCHHQLRHQ